jgi:hypothetical protein
MHEESRALIRRLVDASGGADEVDHVWLVDEHEPGMVLTPAPTVTHEANRIYYVDLYSCGSLMLYIPERETYSAPTAHRYLALDSNMFNGFKRYVVDGERGTAHVVGMEQLIDYAVVHRYSILPTPYLLEIIADRGFDAAKPYCEEIVEAVLRLQHIDGTVFLSCRQFSFSDEALDNLEKRYGTRSFQGAAKKRTEETLAGKIPIRAHYYMSYLAILALIAIGLQFGDRDARIAAFDQLLFERVGGSFPRYMLLARLFYYDKITGWIRSAPRNSNYSAQRIRGAAYDVSLTMLNEEVMHLSDPTDPDIVMLVTRDRNLALEAPIIRLKGMSLLKNGRLQVVNPWDETLVNQAFGQNADRIRSEINAKLQDAPAFEVSPAELIDIISEYEARLNVCPSALSSLKF